MNQPDDFATIQVSGHATEEAAIAFIRINNLTDESGYYTTIYKGKPWYAVTLGKYETLAAARKSMNSLPKEIMNHSPWPRSFNAIKQLILAAGENKQEAASAEEQAEQSENQTSWEQGQAAYENGDMEKAFRIWHRLAQDGDSLSQFNLGVMYSRGEGAELNHDKAIEWYLRSAKQGYAPAQFNLGAAYLEGKLTTEDPQKAVAWWQMAAEQGFVQAQFNIASLYCRGIGVEKDMEQCKFWYQRAASNGDVHARKMLDHLSKMEAAQAAASQSGEAEPAIPDATPDPSLAAVAEQSFKAEEEKTAAEEEKTTVRQITADEGIRLQQAQAAFTRNDYMKSYELWLPLAESGIAEAQYSLGFLYQSGWGAEQDLASAVEWYTNAAKQNEPRAQFNLGILLLNGGTGVEKDVESGVLWLTRSAENDNARAKAFLADVYSTGQYGVTASPEKAAYWKSR